MLDKDLAQLYGTETKVLNLAVKRNIKRFPPDFMFQLSKEEYEQIKWQIANPHESNLSISPPPNLRFQNETSSPPHGGTRYKPYAFTEQGVAMLSGVINSDKAIAMNIEIMRVFVEIRRIALKQNDITAEISQINDRLNEHDTQLGHIYNAMENLLDEKATQKTWADRDPIGFKTR